MWLHPLPSPVCVDAAFAPAQHSTRAKLPLPCSCLMPACRQPMHIHPPPPRSPESMLSELRRWPGSSTLEDLKECLDFSSSAWASLYCQLHGAELLLEVRGRSGVAAALAPTTGPRPRPPLLH